jgi:hypothetical protein
VVRLTTCPRGTADGLVVLSVGADADPDVVEREVSGRPGLWGVLLDGEFDWAADSSAALLDAFGDIPIVAAIDLAKPPQSWPQAEVNWIADASGLLAECPTDHDLATRLGTLPWLPSIRDLFLDLDADRMPPSASALSMLETAVSPSCCYLYTPSDYAYRSTLIRNVATSATPWAVRWS